MYEDECRSNTLKRSLVTSIDNIIECETTYLISRHSFEIYYDKAYIKECYREIKETIIKYVNRYKDMLTGEDWYNLMHHITDKIQWTIDTLYLIFKDLRG